MRLGGPLSKCLILGDSFNLDETPDEHIHDVRSYLLAKSKISAKLGADEAVSRHNHCEGSAWVIVCGHLHGGVDLVEPDLVVGVSMIRSELVQLLVKANPGLSMREVDNIVTVFFDTITEHLAGDGRVELRGFGAFSTRSRGARVGRNPRTGIDVEIKAKRVPHFKPGKEIRLRLND